MGSSRLHSEVQRYKPTAKGLLPSGFLFLLLLTLGFLLLRLRIRVEGVARSTLSEALVVGTVCEMSPILPG